MKTESLLFNFVKLTGCIIEKSKEVAIMILGLKYTFWYLVSHYHFIRMGKCLGKEKKYILNDRLFRYFLKRFIYHNKMFDTIQDRLDALKEEMINKYPDLAD